MSLKDLDVLVLCLENSAGSYPVGTIWGTVSIEREIRISQAGIKLGKLFSSLKNRQIC